MILGQVEQETNAKERSSMNSASKLTNPLELVKKTCQPLESFNSGVWARSYAQSTILGQNEQETDAKNGTSTYSASELTNPLEMINKTFQAFESLNSDVRARSLSQITILGQDEKETDAKKTEFKEFSFWAHEPLRNGKKKHVSLLNRSILMSELGVRPKLRFWAKMSGKQTQKIGLQQIQHLSSRTRYKW